MQEIPSIDEGDAGMTAVKNSKGQHLHNWRLLTAIEDTLRNMEGIPHDQSYGLVLGELKQMCKNQAQKHLEMTT